MAAIGDPGMQAAGAPEATILDWLNEDCWRLLLGYVPVEDIIRSESVSRQWQDIVHRYLQDVGLRIQRYDHPYFSRHRCGRKITLLKGRSEAVDHASGFVNRVGVGVSGKNSVWSKIVQKWGECIVACECTQPQNFKIVVRYCPNLEELAVSGIESDKVKKKTFLLKKLRRVSFQFCDLLSDAFVSKFLENTTLEELVFDRNLQGMTGLCLSDLKSNLKSIHLNCNFGFEFDHLLNSDRISNLTKLDLSEMGVNVVKNLHLLLEKTPNLESLCLDGYNDMRDCFNEKVLLETISRLGRFKQISLRRNYNVSDGWLEALGRCPRIRSVDVAECSVTGLGLAGLCRGAGATLAQLSVEGNHLLTHEDLLACIYACPNLKVLSAGWCAKVSVSLDVFAHELATARARGDVPRGLRVRLNDEKLWKRALSRQAKGLAKQLDFVDSQYYPNAIICYPWMQELRTSKRR